VDRRLVGRVTTPGATGGRPAVVHSSSHQASRWASNASSSGVQEARISICAEAASAAMAPKLSDATRVTVPLAAVKPARWLSRDSVSQAHPTPGRSGSEAISCSSSART
jgi:hypothetical protein